MEPENLLYTKEHEWILIEDGIAVIGITDYAQEELGDITFVELPSPGDTVTAGDTPATLESVKAVSSVYTPFDGVILEVNPELEDEPEIINSSPYADGWIFKIKIDKTDESELMSAEEYQDYIDELD